MFRPPAIRSPSGNFQGRDRPQTPNFSSKDYTEIAIGGSGLFGLQLVDLVMEFRELWEEAFGTPAEMDQG
ncbi:hypothetical protein NG799_14725 [Laspinema sp. D1]|uniref:Uncharacterized protein n=1 Tax=Laspinema palackyanum D2a TaxID=2953684 RepID=A0ABT2MSS8_9CYAN|nr:hypothetical protein [Laspinema sp. D2a]